MNAAQFVSEPLYSKYLFTQDGEVGSLSLRPAVM